MIGVSMIGIQLYDRTIKLAGKIKLTRNMHLNAFAQCFLYGLFHEQSFHYAKCINTNSNNWAKSCATILKAQVAKLNFI